MPYKHEPLKQGEIDILRRWIKQGAHWGKHWAYTSVKAGWGAAAKKYVGMFY